MRHFLLFLSCFLLTGCTLLLIPPPTSFPESAPEEPVSSAKLEPSLSIEAELFEEVSEQAGIDASHEGTWRMFKADFSEGYMAVGQAWGDYDNDGWLDLYVTGNMQPNALFRNNGDGTFARSPLSESMSMPNIWSGGAVWADYDNDGWKDLYVLTRGRNVLFQNDEGMGFRDVTDSAGVGDMGKGQTATWGDYDGDSYLDLYVTTYSCWPECVPEDVTQAQDRLYHNKGDGTFEDVSALLVYEKLLGAGFTASFSDYDGDGDPDIYVVNDALKNPVGNVFWRNDGADTDGRCGGWCWTDAGSENGAGIVIEGMGLAVGDYDNDLDLDMYFSNMVNPSAMLHNDNNTFVEVAREADVEAKIGATVGWGAVFFDYNNDGWLDLYLSTTEFVNIDRETPPDGMHFDLPNILYHNNRNGTFTEVISKSWLESPQRSMGAAYADYDQDGWIDFVTGDCNRGYKLYRNLGIAGEGHNWLSVRLQGGGPINRDAIGARVLVTSRDGHTQMREVKSGSSLGAGNDTALHFGLGAAEVKWVSILWPDGSLQLFKNVPVNRVWSVSYDERNGDMSR